MNSTGIATLITEYGIFILAPLAVIEGPIVTIIAAYLARLSLLDITDVIICVILADLFGDCLLYAAGRRMLSWLPLSLRKVPGASPERVAELARTFRGNGFRLLVIGKLTHAVGFAVLIAAGAARMPFMTFLLANILAAIPKSLAFVALGYFFGSAHEQMGPWIFYTSAGVVAGAAAGLTVLFWKRRRASS